MRRASKRLTLLLVSLLLVHMALALLSVRHKSNTFDEVIHLTAGYTYWQFNDYRFQPENGNLPQRWVALPLIFEPKNFPKTVHNVWDAGHAFFFKLDNDAAAMLFKGRFMVVLLSTALGFAVFAVSRNLFGPLGGIISLILYVFSPTILAHGRLTTSDMSAALFFVISLWSLWIMLHRMTILSLGVASLSVCALLLSKMSGVLIIPVYGLLVMVRLIQNRPLSVKFLKRKRITKRRSQLVWFLMASIIIVAISFSGIWGAYGFRFQAAKDSASKDGLSFSSWEAKLSNTGAPGEVIRFVRDEKWLPEAFLFGFAHVLSHAQQRSAFMNGQYSNRGWWYFFPFCISVKTPLSLMVLCLLTAVAFVALRKPHDIYNVSPLLLLGAVYLMAALTNRMNIGHRHILVLYPLIFILSGVLSRCYEKSKRVFLILSPAFLLVFILETQSVYPHYLAFFNRLAGGPGEGYRKLVDSSLDWGQDLPGLKKWMRERSPKEKSWPVHLAYFGTASPLYHGIDVNIIPVHPFPWMKDARNRSLLLKPGYYCISATALQQVYGIHGEWTQAHEREYRLLKKKVSRYLVNERGPSHKENGASSTNLRDLLNRFERLRFARLCAHLREREPDGNVGYSILIYFLSPGEVDLALHGPIPIKGK